MRIALDTNRYVDLCMGIEEMARLVASSETVLLPFIVVGELRASCAGS